jgi:hypothetical protein
MNYSASRTDGDQISTPTIRFRFTPSLLLLIFSNLLTILLAYFQRWEAGVVFWVFWNQSIIIGIYNFLRIWLAAKIDTSGISTGYDNEPLKPSERNKRQMAGYFVLSYGFFHFLYAFFIWAFTQTNPFTRPEIIVPTLIFLANHSITFLMNYPQEKNNVLNVGCAFIFPYTRVVPMHLALILGAFFLGGSGIEGVIILMCIKSVIDILVHFAEHGVYYPSLSAQAALNKDNTTSPTG